MQANPLNLIDCLCVYILCTTMQFDYKIIFSQKKKKKDPIVYLSSIHIYFKFQIKKKSEALSSLFFVQMLNLSQHNYKKPYFPLYTYLHPISFYTMKKGKG